MPTALSGAGTPPPLPLLTFFSSETSDLLATPPCDIVETTRFELTLPLLNTTAPQ